MEKVVSYSGLIAGPRNTAVSSGFYSLMKAIRRCNSKGEEERIIQKELALIRQNLSQPDVSLKKMKEFMVRLMYCEILGQSANFAYIQAIKMAQQGILLNKRVGYLCVNLFLHSQHELILLLINTIQKDLKSTNILDVCGALTVCSNLIGREMMPVVLPHVEKHLQHPEENVRRKAVLVLHSFLLKQPQILHQLTEHFQQALCDRSPSVMTAALHIYNTLIKDMSENYQTLVRPLTSILKQVVERKLTSDYEFRGIPAPWLQIQVIKMLTRLGCNNPKASGMMYDVLEEVLDSSNTLSLISCGVQYECIMTLAKIHPNKSLLKKAALCITRFVRSQSNNLKYLGMKAFGAIHKVDPEYCVEHQMIVVECLQDDDPTIKRVTMNLLYDMCNSDNISVILDKMLAHLHSSNVHEVNQSEHIGKIVTLAHQYHPTMKWYITIIVKILNHYSSYIPPDTVNNVIISLQQQEDEEEGLISYLVEEMFRVTQQIHIPEELIKLVSWVLGEFGCSAKSSIPASEILDGLCGLLSKTMSSSITSCVVAAIAKLVATSGLALDVQDITATIQASHSVQVKQISSELEILCSIPNTLPLVQEKADSQFDWTLSFLDEFVSDALGHGAAPYKPKQQRSAEQHNSPEVMRPFLAGLNFKPYKCHSSSVMTNESSSSFPTNNQDAGSSTSSPPPSLRSDSIANSNDVDLITRPLTLKTEGIQKVWSEAGYSRAKEAKKKMISPKKTNLEEAATEDNNEATKQPFLNTIHATGMSFHQVESEDERRKQELAKALFGAGATQPEHDKNLSSQVKFPVDREELRRTEAFADYCTEDGLIVPGETNHHLLLNMGLQNVQDGTHLVNLDLAKKPSESVKKQSITFEGNQRDSKFDVLLDDCEPMPPLPSSLELSDGVQAAEELVYNSTVRLMMQRIWQNDALGLVFYVTSPKAIEAPTIKLDLPSNVKCFCDKQETNVLDVSTSGVIQAKLMCNVPAANMSVGGELMFKDHTRTHKRFFFHTPIHIQDFLRAKHMTTEEFGKLWPELSLDHRLVLNVSSHTLLSIMNILSSIHLFPVEIIGEEGILAASLLENLICLIHIKLNQNKLDIWVKSRSKLFSQILANKCVDVVKNAKKN